ncbi:uncharacterized protein DNG_00288 [Cephalotrichum gorgonifer]|uniref:HCNGP-like protein n=1 Tax=Cephalotrichum gorgonifer TaxID=2041049 RepID=A0AAE8SQL8_9PEZI|nr:uncharacterized protein DNG_00288 [Cephalotrichum gorgonifer]
MAGLVSYESSDEEDVIESPREQKQNGTKTSEPVVEDAAPEKAPESAPPAQPEPSLSEPAPFVGPMPPPNFTSADLPSPSPSPLPDLAPPGSPYTSHRALLRDLTLPTHPNLDLPPSPPGSPPPPLTQKITTFLSLKEKGTHFNARLQSSPALRNPALMDKLLAFTGTEADQYATTVATDLWDPAGFPGWAFRSELRGARERQRREREGERKETGRVEFVPSSGAGLATSEGTGTGGLSKRRKLE